MRWERDNAPILFYSKPLRKCAKCGKLTPFYFLFEKIAFYKEDGVFGSVKGWKDPEEKYAKIR